MNSNLVDKIKKMLRKKDKNPNLVVLKKREKSFFNKITKNVAREIVRAMNEYTEIVTYGQEEPKPFKVFKSRDLEIDQAKKWEKERKENELPHPIEK